MRGRTIIILVLLLSLVIPGLWTSVPQIKDTVHFLLNPTLGVLMNWNATFGFILTVFILTFITVFIYKHTTDQNALKEIKAEQKKLQEQMKLNKGNQSKMMEINKKSMELTMKSMPITMRPAIFTMIPFIFLFRWFTDYFTANPAKIFGFMHWIVAYLILSILFSPIFRKIFKVH